ncbi:TraI/MobA(P) family conjugative relaxase [Pseudomonas sp. DC3000-4b1]|uniref:TraI/MobA(P) family conjugative relaxase n=1 Tax=unclassified Pseudomonas TaxID=196821 RepID=UPI003CF9DDF0
MNVIVPEKRKDKGTSFLKLVSYVTDRAGKPSPDDLVTSVPQPNRSESSRASFERLVDYIERTGESDAPVKVSEQFADGRQRVMAGEVACETNVFSLETAAAEMNMVASQNRRIKDPVYHFIISWREEDHPTDEQVFGSALYAMKSIGLEGHQYVTAIHRDTDNVHAHIAVNRVHPLTYVAANMWNDVDTLQKSMRVLERHYGFVQDNGPWQMDADNQLYRAGVHYPSAPRGAGARKAFSNQESLYHYAVEHVREKLNDRLKSPGFAWQDLHLLLHSNGLGLREKGSGLVIYNFLRPDDPPVKASSVHPSLTKTRLEPICGVYSGPPAFKSDDPLQGEYGIFRTYQPSFEVRDKGAREERRQERADARASLKQRYQDYRSAWEKPDLNTKARYKQVAVRYQAMKADVKRTHDDPLLRKLMYRVAEFERMKDMAALRIELRQEREKLALEGKLRPLQYRAWVEQEALNGDLAAISQLRGFAYREKRKGKTLEGGMDRVILFAKADDSPVYNPATHTPRLYRNGTVEYVRDGVPGVVDRGGLVQVKPGFEDYDESANFKLAASLAATKSGEAMKVIGDEGFVDQVLDAGSALNQRAGKYVFLVTDKDQLMRYDQIENSRPSVATEHHNKNEPISDSANSNEPNLPSSAYKPY